MTIDAHLTTFHGLRVANFSFETGLEDPASVAYRLNMGEGRQSLLEELEGVDDDANNAAQYALVIERLGRDPNAATLRALVIGEWVDPWDGGGDAIVRALLLQHRERFPALEAVFLGDMTYDQCDISALFPPSVEGLLASLPALQRLGVRGVGGPTVGGGTSHDGLRCLTLESGGLDHTTAEQVCAAQFPNLEELELWLGTEYYGRTTDVATLTPLLSGKLFPKLRRLGPMNADIADEVAQAVASSPLLNQLEELDLSYGTLGDAGAEALLAAPGVATLKRLDLTRHYCSPGVVERLQALPAEVTADDAQGDVDPDDRYVMAGE